MGFFDVIKQTYNKVDTALGGYLPGGQTPSQVKNKPAPISVPASSSFVSNPSGNAVSNIGAIKTAATPAPNTSTNAGPVYVAPGQNVSTRSSSSSRNYSPAPNTSTVNGPVYVAPGQNVPNTSTPQGAVYTPPPATTTTPQQTQTVVSSRTSSQPQQQTNFDEFGQPRYSGDNPLLKAADWYFSTDNPLVTPTRFDPNTGRALEPMQEAAIALPGLGTLSTQIPKNFGVTLTEQATAQNTAKIGAQKVIQPLEEKGAQALAGTTTGDVAKAATGQLVKSPNGEVINTATQATKLAWIRDFTQAYKYPLMMAGAAASWLSSGVFSYNELNDDIAALGIKANEATKNGDLEYAQELTDRMKELNDYNSLTTVLKGPVGYVQIASLKGADAVKYSQASIDRTKELKEKDTLLEAKYLAGTITPDELTDYMDRNPYSALTAIEKQKQIAAAKDIPRDALGNPLYGAVNENGVYVPSYTEQAKRLEAEQYYNNIKNQPKTTTGGTTGNKQTSQYEPPSTLSFGLLKTPGGYQLVDKNSAPEGSTFETDTGTISNYYFGVPYASLTPEQKQLVDMMSNG